MAASNSSAPTSTAPNSTTQGSATQNSTTSTFTVFGCGHCGVSKTPGGKPLRRCTRCEIQVYCSTDCQEKHWETHKAKCKKRNIKSSGYKRASNMTYASDSDDLYTVRLGVLIAPQPAAAANGSAADHAAALSPSPPDLDEAAIRQQKLYLLPVSQAVGFPLCTVSVPSGDPQAINYYNECLMLDVDLNSPTFGQPNWGPKRPLGTAMVVRHDLKPLHFIQVKALVEFCSMFIQVFRLAVLQGVAEKAGKKVDKYELAAMFLHPQGLQEIL